MAGLLELSSAAWASDTWLLYLYVIQSAAAAIKQSGMKLEVLLDITSLPLNHILNDRPVDARNMMHNGVEDLRIFAFIPGEEQWRLLCEEVEEVMGAICDATGIYENEIWEAFGSDVVDWIVMWVFISDSWFWITNGSGRGRAHVSQSDPGLHWMVHGVKDRLERYTFHILPKTKEIEGWKRKRSKNARLNLQKCYPLTLAVTPWGRRYGFGGKWSWRDFVGRGGNPTRVQDLDSRQCMIAFNRLAQKEICLRSAAFNWMRTMVWQTSALNQV